MLKQTIAGVIIALTLTSAAGAGRFEDAYAAFERGDYTTANSLWRRLAERGHSVSRHMLGLSYYYGEGVLQDIAEAEKWVRMSAEQENVEAMTTLGTLYVTGSGVPKSYVLAHMWYTLAAARDSVEAAANLNNVIEKMTPEQLSKGQRLARKWETTRQRISSSAGSKLTGDLRVEFIDDFFSGCFESGNSGDLIASPGGGPTELGDYCDCVGPNYADNLTLTTMRSISEIDRVALADRARTHCLAEIF